MEVQVSEIYNTVKESEVKDPITSIVIPSYNSEGTVRRAVLSALAQETQLPYSVTVIDNGTRVQLEKCLEDMLSDPKLTLLKEVNPGLSMSLNLGFCLSNAKYFMQLDADDELLPYAVEVFAQTFLRNPNLVYGYSDCFWIGHLPKEEWGWEKVSKADPKKFVNIWLKPEFSQDRILHENYCGHAKCFTREAFFNIGGFDANLNCGEDWDFILKISELGEVRRVPHVLHKYYLLDSGMTNSTGEQEKSDARKKIITRTMIRRNLTMKDIPASLKEKLSEDHLWT